MRTLCPRFLAMLVLSFSALSQATAQGTKKVGEVPEAPDSYRDPGFSNPGPAAQSPAVTNAVDPSILNFKGQRSPGLPETLKPEERPNFPNFRFSGTNQVVLSEERNGKKLERIVSRQEFELMKKEFEKKEKTRAEHEAKQDSKH
jgi:hypothetical protein